MENIKYYLNEKHCIYVYNYIMSNREYNNFGPCPLSTAHTIDSPTVKCEHYTKIYNLSIQTIQQQHSGFYIGINILYILFL